MGTQIQYYNTQWSTIQNMFSTGPIVAKKKKKMFLTYFKYKKDGFFDQSTTLDLYRSVQRQFQQLACPLESVGNTEENRDIYLTCLTLLDKNNDLNNQQGVFINSLHHAREVMSLTMQLYTYAYLIYQYFQGDQQTIDFLKNNVIWFIPVVNVDGYEMLIKIEKQCEHNVLQGVDLNRNYGTAFGIDDIGSSPDPCNIIAFTPEIGYMQNGFYPSQNKIIKSLEINLPPIMYMIYKMNHDP
ncbi:zinc carboxypeptidase family protein, putative, partial [Ichthyophthirius multifiliis]